MYVTVITSHFRKIFINHNIYSVHETNYLINFILPQIAQPRERRKEEPHIGSQAQLRMYHTRQTQLGTDQPNSSQLRKDPTTKA
jgi:hypothetical protein